MQSPHVDEGSFIFGPFQFFPETQSLLRGREQVRLGSRAISLLQILVSHAGSVVSKDALIAYAWPNATVDEANLKVHISALRRMLGDTKSRPFYIATVPGQGYKFTAPVLMAGAREVRESLPRENSRLGPCAGPDIVGRDRETQKVVEMVGSAPVVTLIGPAGVGKASIARSVATAMLADFEGGCCFVDFSGTRDDGNVSTLIAMTLGLIPTATDMTSSLLDYLEHRSILLVFDHCDHAGAAVRLFVSRFTASSSPARILAISLEPLRVPGESVCRVGLMAYPTADTSETLTTDAALTYPAIQMLVRRANELSGYELDESDLPAIVGLCRVMDGRPRS